MGAGFGIDLPHGRTALFRGKPVFARVAVGADGCIELGSIRARGQILRPVVVDRSGREIGDLLSHACNLSLARRIVEAQHGIRIGNVEIVTHQDHAERRI